MQTELRLSGVSYQDLFAQGQQAGELAAAFLPEIRDPLVETRNQRALLWSVPNVAPWHCGFLLAVVAVRMFEGDL